MDDRTMLLRQHLPPHSSHTPSSFPLQGDSQVTWFADQTSFETVWGAGTFFQNIVGYDDSELRLRQAVLLVKGQTAGVALVLAKDDPEVKGARVGWLQSLGVLPRFRGLGLSRMLVQAALARTMEFGHRKAFLFVESSNLAALSLYTTSGYEPVLEGPEDDLLWKRIASNLECRIKQRRNGIASEQTRTLAATAEEELPMPEGDKGGENIMGLCDDIVSFRRRLLKRLGRLEKDPTRLMSSPTCSAFAVCGLSALLFAHLRLCCGKDLNEEPTLAERADNLPTPTSLSLSFLVDLACNRRHETKRRFLKKQRALRRKGSHLASAMAASGEFEDSIADVALCWGLSDWLERTRPTLYSQQLAFSASSFFTCPDTSPPAFSVDAGDLCLEPTAIIALASSSSSSSPSKNAYHPIFTPLDPLRFLHASMSASIGDDESEEQMMARALPQTSTKQSATCFRSAGELQRCLDDVFEAASSMDLGNVATCECTVNGQVRRCERLSEVVLIVGKRHIGDGGNGGDEGGGGGGGGDKGGNCWDGHDLEHWFVVENLTRTISRGAKGDAGSSTEEMKEASTKKAVTAASDGESEGKSEGEPLFGGGVWNYSGNGGRIFDLSGSEYGEEVDLSPAPMDNSADEITTALATVAAAEAVLTMDDPTSLDAHPHYPSSQQRTQVAAKAITPYQPERILALPALGWFNDLGVTCLVAVAVQSDGGVRNSRRAVSKRKESPYL